MSQSGETLGAGTGADAPRYIVHPAGGSGWAGDAKPMDAGTAQIFENNLAVLSRESCRHLGWSRGPGVLVHTPDMLASGWDGYEDAAQFRRPSGVVVPPTVTSPFWQAIAWDYRTSRTLGPFNGVQDRTTADGLKVLREVFVEVQLDAPAPATPNGLHLYAALTVDPSPPSENNTIANATLGPLVAGQGVALLRLAPGDPIGASLGVRCRASGALGAVAWRVPAYWVWVGWRSSLANAAILAVSAYEAR